MKRTRPGEISGTVSECPHDFTCHTTGLCGNQARCQVSFEGGHNLLFLKGENFRECIYREYVGIGWLCRCPMHFADYVKSKQR